MNTTTTKKRSGFTLIELSIVLVIIGLIVGGVLVGQDLIKAAELRATIGQLEKYNSAVNTFRGKFGGVPGDLAASQASAFGLFAFTGASAGTLGLGDGNGLLQSTTSGTPALGIGEPLAFWRHLSDTNLIDGAFGSSGNSAISTSDGQAGGDVTNVSASLPPAKMGRGNYLAVYSPASGTVGAGLNFYELNSVVQITAASGNYTTQTNSQMTPREANNIDAKVDDGMPNTGSILARGPQAAGGGGALNQNPLTTCTLNTTATTPYVLSSETPTCALRARFN